MINGLLASIHVKAWRPKPILNVRRGSPISFEPLANAFKQQELRAREIAGRDNLDEFSLHVSWGRFIPLPIVNLWIDSDELVRLNFIRTAESVLLDYDLIVGRFEAFARGLLAEDGLVSTTPVVTLPSRSELRKSLMWERRLQALPWIGLQATPGLTVSLDFAAMQADFEKEVRVLYAKRLLKALPSLPPMRVSDTIAVATLRRIEKARLLGLSHSPGLEFVLEQISKECRNDWLRRDDANLRKLSQDAQKLVEEEFGVKETE